MDSARAWAEIPTSLHLILNGNLHIKNLVTNDAS